MSNYHCKAISIPMHLVPGFGWVIERADARASPAKSSVWWDGHLQGQLSHPSGGMSHSPTLKHIRWGNSRNSVKMRINTLVYSPLFSLNMCIGFWYITLCHFALELEGLWLLESKSRGFTWGPKSQYGGGNALIVEPQEPIEVNFFMGSCLYYAKKVL